MCHFDPGCFAQVVGDLALDLVRMIERRSNLPHHFASAVQLPRDLVRRSAPRSGVAVDDGPPTVRTIVQRTQLMQHLLKRRRCHGQRAKEVIDLSGVLQSVRRMSETAKRLLGFGCVVNRIVEGRHQGTPVLAGLRRGQGAPSSPAEYRQVRGPTEAGTRQAHSYRADQRIAFVGVAAEAAPAVHLRAYVDAGRRLLVPYERLADALCELGGSEKEPFLKLTVDSTESLDDALRVVGALYGVTLVVSEEGRNTSNPTPRRTTKPKKTSVGTSPRSRAAVADTGSGRSRTRKAAASAEAPSNVEVRSWARKTGLSVSDRGRVPASVMAAYRSAH